MAGAPAMAQDKAAAKKTPPPTASVTTNQQAKSAWVKLCEKAPFNRKGKDGKDIKEEKNICLTHHERLDGNTGAVLVSAAIREVDGSDKKSLMIMVPLGMAIPPGIRAAVYTKDQWAKAAKNAAAKPVGFPVPLAGFTAAHDGKPIDNKEYAKARGQLMAQIRKRQAEAMEKAKAEKMKLLPPQPGTGATVKSAPAKK
jgi:invasion protein IalB